MPTRPSISEPHGELDLLQLAAYPDMWATFPFEHFCLETALSSMI